MANKVYKSPLDLGNELLKTYDQDLLNQHYANFIDNMAYKSISEIPAIQKQKFVFDYPDSLEEINDALKTRGDYFDDIDLGDGYVLTPYRNKVYGNGQDYNVEFDIINGDDIVDTLGVYGRKFDEDYQNQLQEIIRNHKNTRRQ